MSQTRCPSELDWTRHLAGELGWLASRRLRAHVAGCAACRQALAGMAADRAAFVADPRRQRDLSALTARARTQAPRRPRRPWMLAGLALAAATAAAAVVVLRMPGREPGWIAKGGDLLTVHVETASGAVPLGATCAAGDRLMASWTTGHAYLLLLERDGERKVQTLFPPGGTASAHLAAPRGTTTQSFVLDEVRGQECFAAFFSEAPIDAARAGAALSASTSAPQLSGATVRMQCCVKAGAP